MDIRQPKEFVPNDRDKLKGSLTALHMLVAGFTKVEQMALSPQEAKSLTEALADVLDKHNINVTGAVSVEVTLIATVLMVEGPRFKMLRELRRSRTSPIPEPGPVGGLPGAF